MITAKLQVKQEKIQRNKCASQIPDVRKNRYKAKSQQIYYIHKTNLFK